MPCVSLPVEKLEEENLALYEQTVANVQRQREADAKTAELLKAFDDVRTYATALMDSDLTVDRCMRDGVKSPMTRLVFGLCKQLKIYPQHTPKLLLLLPVEGRLFSKGLDGINPHLCTYISALPLPVQFS